MGPIPQHRTRKLLKRTLQIKSCQRDCIMLHNLLMMLLNIFWITTIPQKLITYAKNFYIKDREVIYAKAADSFISKMGGGANIPAATMFPESFLFIFIYFILTKLIFLYQNCKTFPELISTYMSR